jgi:hypothetical protein
MVSAIRSRKLRRQRTEASPYSFSKTRHHRRDALQATSGGISNTEMSSRSFIPRANLTNISYQTKNDQALCSSTRVSSPSVPFQLPDGISSVVLDTFMLYQRSFITASDLKSLCDFYLKWLKSVTGTRLRPKEADLMLDRLRGAKSALTDITFNNLPPREINNLKCYIYLLFHLGWELLTSNRCYGVVVTGWMACSSLTAMYLRLLRAMSRSTMFMTGIARIGTMSESEPVKHNHQLSARLCYMQLISSGLSIILAAEITKEIEDFKTTCTKALSKAAEGRVIDRDMISGSIT